MTTNFYMTTRENVCDHCGRADKETRHIGHSAAGWCFALHIYPDDGIAHLTDWLRLWAKPTTTIADEYGKPLSRVAMLDWITNRSRPLRQPDTFNYAGNAAVLGPNNLIRRQIISVGLCVGHGSGTWDLLEGDFS